MNKSSIEESGVAIDWDIKSTPRYCFWLMLDAKKNYIYYMKRRRHSEEDYAKYISNFLTLYSIIRPNWGEDKREIYDKLYFENIEFTELLKLENTLVEWLFKEGFFKMTDGYKKYADVADMIDEER